MAFAKLSEGVFSSGFGSGYQLLIAPRSNIAKT
jgi:hypothetical protein